jgi:antitoxin component YwqK of YwqJK toxin-antitoxin module
MKYKNIHSVKIISDDIISYEYYHRGLPIGEWKKYHRGKLIEERNYVIGGNLQYNKYYSYSDDMLLISISFYKHILDGPTIYYKNGKPHIQYNFAMGVLLSKKYF